MEDAPLFTVFGMPFRLDARLRSLATLGVLLVGIAVLSAIRRRRSR